MAITKIHPIKSTLRQTLAYILEPKKTDEGILVSSFACSPETADLEFDFTLSHCMEKGNNLAFHLIQSFKPGETNQETAHKIGADLAQEVLKGRYEYVLSTHVDKGHIHNHLIFCAANFVDYHKYISNRKSYYQIRKASDLCCEQYGLSIVIPGEEKGKCYKEYLAQMLGISWKDRLKKTINQSIKYSTSFEEFTLRMNLAGYEVKLGSKLAFRATDQKQYILSHTLGTGFTKNRIYQKISQQVRESYQARNYMRLDSFMELMKPNTAIQKPGSSQNVNTQNLKKAAKTLNYLTEMGIDSLAKLEAKQCEIKTAFDETKSELKALEKKIASLSEIEKQLRVIEKLETHKINDKNIALFSTLQASKSFLALLGFSEPYPSCRSLTTERMILKEKKNNLYHRYYRVKKEWTGIKTIIQNFDQILRLSEKDEPIKD